MEAIGIQAMFMQNTASTMYIDFTSEQGRITGIQIHLTVNMMWNLNYQLK